MKGMQCGIAAVFERRWTEDEFQIHGFSRRELMSRNAIRQARKQESKSKDKLWLWRWRAVAEDDEEEEKTKKRRRRFRHSHKLAGA